MLFNIATAPLESSMNPDKPEVPRRFWRFIKLSSGSEMFKHFYKHVLMSLLVLASYLKTQPEDFFFNGTFSSFN